MEIPAHVIQTPWDSRALGIKTYEVQHLSEKVLKEINCLKGHFTVRVDPLSSKRLLHEGGFYYCDTLMEPYCTPESFFGFFNPSIEISDSVDEQELMDMAHGAFIYGRFHRDFQISNQLADLRYDLWLKDIYDSGQVLGVTFAGELAGFFGLDQSKIALNALGRKHRGKRLAKFFWSEACRHLFNAGYSEITSSVSTANVAIVNIYAALGFRFRNPKDIYHRLNK